VFAHPERMLELRRERADRASDALAASMARCLERNGRHLQESVGRLEALSPLAVMRRGYAALWKETGAVTTVGEISVGDRLHMRLSDGTVSSTVTAVHLIEERE
jgi:exodeoxyribonuclease VII large subunit